MRVSHFVASISPLPIRVWKDASRGLTNLRSNVQQAGVYVVWNSPILPHSSELAVQDIITQVLEQASWETRQVYILGDSGAEQTNWIVRWSMFHEDNTST